MRFLDQHWNFYDTDKVGYIKKAQAKAIVHARFGQEFPNNFEKEFSRIDITANGKVNKNQTGILIMNLTKIQDI